MSETIEEASKRWIFLSHNSLDKPLVEKIGHELLDHGVPVWLDKWNLVPGRPWVDDVAKAIRQAAATVVFIGSHGRHADQLFEILSSANGKS